MERVTCADVAKLHVSNQPNALQRTLPPGLMAGSCDDSLSQSQFDSRLWGTSLRPVLGTPQHHSTETPSGDTILGTPKTD
uniref:Uncharacterized protein n=1 Tax=Anguilla anguilla TaxID=7936 RepID=A0A0E9Q9Q0_ANGAN